MRIPNAEEAQVDSEKLKRYLLSETHPLGRSKAKFFRGLGFDGANITVLAERLIAIAKTEDIAESTPSLYGMKYVIESFMVTPSGNSTKLRTVWIVENGHDFPRFVTAYPL